MSTAYLETSLLIVKTVSRLPPRSPQTCFFFPIYTVYSVRSVTMMKVHTHQHGPAFSNEVIDTTTTYTLITSDPSSQAYLEYTSFSLQILPSCTRGRKELRREAQTGLFGSLKPWALSVVLQVVKVLELAFCGETL